MSSNLVARPKLSEITVAGEEHAASRAPQGSALSLLHRYLDDDVMTFHAAPGGEVRQAGVGAQGRARLSQRCQTFRRRTAFAQNCRKSRSPRRGLLRPLPTPQRPVPALVGYNSGLDGADWLLMSAERFACPTIF